MSTIAIVPAVFALAALAWLWQQRRHSPGAGLLVQAILPALVPPAAAAAIAGWSVRAAFVEIGSSGSAGVGSLTVAMKGPAEALAVGVAGFVVVLAGAFAMAMAGRTPAGGDAGKLAARRAWGAILVAVLALAVAAPVVHAADRVVFESFGRLTAGLLKSSGGAVPPTPALVTLATPESTPLGEHVSDMERQITVAAWGGSALCAILIVASVISARNWRRPGATIGWLGATQLALGALGGAVVYGWYVWEAVRWLSATAVLTTGAAH